MNNSLRFLITLVFAVCVGSASHASDRLFMKSGRTYEGRILTETASTVSILRDGITLEFDKKTVDKIEREKVEAAANVLPSAEKILEAAQAIAPEPWVQIPATVIDEGVLRNVPYRSYRAGTLELNIYGDPAAPAGMEVGIYESSTALPFKKKLVAFVAEATNAEFPGSFDIVQDKKKLGLIDYEVTPASAPDAYGAWWISAYDMTRLQAARVADNEMNALTAQRASVAKATAQETEKRRQDEWNAGDLARAVRPTDVGVQPTGEAQVSFAPSPSYGSGRVWVRSYTRKDGTYVRGHTRSR